MSILKKLQNALRAALNSYQAAKAAKNEQISNSII